MDRIDIHAIKCRVNLGVPAAERRSKQTVWIDLGLSLPLARAGRSDDFKFSPDYHATALTVREAVEAKPFKLIEALAARVAEICMANERVQAVEVTLRKPGAIRNATAAGVTIRRSR